MKHTFTKLTLLVFAGIIFSIGFQITSCFAQPTFVWAKSMGGTDSDRGYSIAVDGSGNVYTTGSFTGTADFDPGAGTYNLTSAGAEDIFISKLDAAGNFVWAKSMGGLGGDIAYSIAMDWSGNIYTTGSFTETADFDPSTAGTYTLSAGSLNSDIFISKLDAAGDFVWAKSMGGSDPDAGYSIAIDGAGYVYTTGLFLGTVDFDPGAGTYTLSATSSSPPKRDPFVSKLDAAGNFVWAISMSGNLNDVARSLALDGSGNVYITGEFIGTIDADPSSGTYYLIAAGGGGMDAFVSKFDASGNLVWAVSMGGSTGFDRGHSIALDGSGNVYITGSFAGIADFDPSTAGTYTLNAATSPVFVSKLDASGNFVWAFNVGNITGNGFGTGTYPESIAIDPSGNVYIMGDQYSPTADYDPSSGVFNLSNTDAEANFIAKYNNIGNFICAMAITPGHNEADMPNRHIAVDGSNNVWVTSSFTISTTDFNYCTPFYNPGVYGSNDIYVAKYDFSSCSCPLPVELLYFNAIAENNSLVRCEWSTASEINNDYFSIERSKDGINFSQIGTVKGAGNSSVTLNYIFYDHEPYSGVSYYRLKQFDYNGAFSYSPIRPVYIGTLDLIIIYPNPSTDGSIDYTVASEAGGELSVKVYDVIGRKVISNTETLEGGVVTKKLSTAALSSGSYLLQITNGNLEKTQKQFVIR
ncbi:MAG: SBBP repeat-containing protein [Bacteroidetes bacterium]|nr:SBBP repeat-containing protein [Bacteroidota bacterium]